jgi:hypothetical protein
MKRLSVLLIMLFCISFFCTQQLLAVGKKPSATGLKGAYLGQKYPGLIPEIFAPGIISTGMR